MPSSPTSDRLRLRQSIADPWALGQAGATGLIAALFGKPPEIVLGVAVLVLAVRVVAEYVLPRTPETVAADAAAVQEASVRRALDSASAAALR